MTSDRKLEHLLLCANCDVEYREKTTGFEDIELIHKAIPELNKEKIDISAEIFGKKMDAPLIISAITGGHPASLSINRDLAKAADNQNIGMGVGSQRAAVENPELIPTYSVVRENAPSAVIIGNIGAPQIEYAKAAAEMIDADALAIHLNPLQESIQPEGDIDARGYIESIKKTVEIVDMPVIAKETGAGISKTDAIALQEAGVAAIDVAGSGGTSWAAVETYRAKDEYLGNLYWNWGIPTAASTVEVCESVEVPVISSGGIRTGLEAAKAIALGAEVVGMALPLLKDAYISQETIIKRIEQFKESLKVAMFLVGANNIKELRKCDLVIRGKTGEWLRERGFNTKKYAQRSFKK
ncbi:MAG: type 2 isopentenyl-diphosphate Delta-isomerase [Methanobacterium sp.]|uniref:type 2 isopentenyl-diphosphate Delta-isomerase n=1 Tax=Methanobacterium sp. TaxID=2164 RepID=UPI003D65388A|nr:type 2 isopentenyl-diphosphate Delta-isomerase [Methanobacterium sp.]